MAELRRAQEVYTGSGRTFLVQSRCSCYPLFVEFAIGVTNGRERERAPKSLWCVRLLLCAGELRSSESPHRRVPRPPFYRSREDPWGTRQKEEGRRGREEREKAEEEALAAVPLSLYRQRPTSPIVEDGSAPPRHHSATVVAAVACRSPAMASRAAVPRSAARGTTYAVFN
jgi:hypothetical protein